MVTSLRPWRPWVGGHRFVRARSRRSGGSAARRPEDHRSRRDAAPMHPQGGQLSKLTKPVRGALHRLGYDVVRTNGAAPVQSLPPDCDEFTRSEEHTSELQSLMRISYAVFCLKKKNIP